MHLVYEVFQPPPLSETPVIDLELRTETHKLGGIAQTSQSVPFK
jgi:hypothetical protein